MTERDRCRLAYRVLAGVWRLRLGGVLYHLHPPTALDRYRAEEVYAEALEGTEGEDLYTEEALAQFLLDNDLWTLQKQSDLDKYASDIEEMKVRAFEAQFRSNERKTLKKTLVFARGEVARLSRERHAYDHLTDVGHAQSMKMRYLVGACLRDHHHRPVWQDEGFWEHSSPLLDEALEIYLREQASEAQLREVARTEPFRSYWSCRKACGGLLGRSAAETTDEQRSLLVWADLYDSVHSHPECPADEVIADDDLLDGWFIVQRRKRGQAGGAPVGNDKIANSGEVFILAETAEDARKIEALNDGQARLRKAQRMGHLARHGEVKEVDMPDTKQSLFAQLHDMQTAKAKGQV